MVEDICCLGMSSSSSCNKDSQILNSKVSSVFGRLIPVWKNKHISLAVEVRLYESLVVSTILGSAELWPLLKHKRESCKQHVTNFSNSYWAVGISWKDKSRNKEVRVKTALQKLEFIIKKRRPRWLGTSCKWMMVDCQNKSFI